MYGVPTLQYYVYISYNLQVCCYKTNKKLLQILILLYNFLKVFEQALLIGT